MPDHLTPAEFASLLGPLAPSPRFAVALSGGPDSMALTLLAREYAHTHRLALTALTVDHGLRPESADEARQVAGWMKARGIPHRILFWERTAPLTGNLPLQARRARYRLLLDWCREHGAPTLLTAHTQDDQAETVLMRLKRGSHLRGLSGIAPESSQQGIRLLRPLLSLPKSRLVATLREAGQPWIEDPSNHSDAYERNRLRRALERLPQAEHRRAQIAAAATRFSALRNRDEAALEDFLQRHTTPTTLDATALLQANPALAIAALSRLLMALGGQPYPPRFSQSEALLSSLRTASPGWRGTLSGCLLSLTNDFTLKIARERLK